MSYLHGNTIKEIETDEGNRRIDLVARKDGKFQFYEYKQAVEEGRQYWQFVHMSGLYESAQTAEQDGRARLISGV